MRLAKMVFVLAALFWPATAQAVEVNLGVGSEAVYDSNVFRSSGKDQGDFSFRFSPTIRIEEQGDRLGADLSYKPTYEAFTTFTDANELSHNLESGLSYRFSDRTYAELRNRFRVLFALNSDDLDTLDEGVIEAPDSDVARDEMFLFDSTLSVSHAISPRWDSNTEIAFDLFDPRGRRQTVASNSVSAFQSFQYAYDRSNIFGIGAGAIVQLFDEVTSIPASNTFIFRLFASYTRNFGESTTLTLRGGPALILTRQDDAEDDTSSTFPFTSINEDTNVGALRKQGFDISSALSDDTPVPRDSVLVTDPKKCIDAVSPNGRFGTVLFQGDRCFNHDLLRRNDPSFPNEFNAIGPIKNDMSEITLFGSDSGSSDSSITFFGDISLTHRWTPQLVSTASYNRSQSTANGQGTTTIENSVSFQTVWRPGPLWDLSVHGGFVTRASPNELSQTFAAVRRDLNPASATFELAMLTGDSVVVENSQSVDTQRWEVQTRVARRITRHVTVSAWAAYSNQISDNTSRNPNDFGNFTAILGFKYDFDPFRF